MSPLLVAAALLTVLLSLLFIRSMTELSWPVFVLLTPDGNVVVGFGMFVGLFCLKGKKLLMKLFFSFNTTLVFCVFDKSFSEVKIDCLIVDFFIFNFKPLTLNSSLS